MPDVSTLLVFSAAALALIVVPGPAVLYIVAQSIDSGRLAGVVSALGVAAGGLVHVTTATIGLSSLLVSSATAFTLVKYAGAAYLIGLGLHTLFVRRAERPVDAPRERRLRRRFWQGVVVNVLNPKTALFFLAFLPQFVDPARGPIWLQATVFSLVFTALGVVSDGAYALAAGAIGNRLRQSGRVRRRLDRVSGGVHIALGTFAALAKNPALR